MSDKPLATSRPECLREHAVEVIDRLRRAGHIAYLAGGCVRDQLLGLSPKDYDVATSAQPGEVRKLFANTQAVGAAFGVILVRHHGSQIEVATFRSDGIYEDGRRPNSVQFSDPQHDAQRRDFTINALFFDPAENKVIDFVGGQEDLARRVLRTVGEPERRFSEDYLRLLRAVRFAARFGLALDPATAGGIIHHAPRIKQISPERIAEELRLMLTPPTRLAAWKLLNDLQLAGHVLRFVPAHRPLDHDLAGVFTRISPGKSIHFSLALAGLWIAAHLRDQLMACLQESSVRTLVTLLRRTLKISNDESQAVRDILCEIGKLVADDSPSVAKRKRFLAHRCAAHARLLLAAMLPLDAHLERISASLEEFAGIDVAPPAFVTGDDLIAAGFSPGPKFKAVLDAVYDAQLENRVRDPSAAMAMAKKLING